MEDNYGEEGEEEEEEEEVWPDGAPPAVLSLHPNCAAPRSSPVRQGRAVPPLKDSFRHKMWVSSGLIQSRIVAWSRLSSVSCSRQEIVEM